MSKFNKILNDLVDNTQRWEKAMKNKLYAKPKESFGNFKKGNLYECEESLKANKIAVKDKDKMWQLLDKSLFTIVEDIFEE